MGPKSDPGWRELRQCGDQRFAYYGVPIQVGGEFVKTLAF